MTDYLLPWAIIEDGYFVAGQRLVSEGISPTEAANIVEKAAETWRLLNPENIEAIEKW